MTAGESVAAASVALDSIGSAFRRLAPTAPAVDSELGAAARAILQDLRVAYYVLLDADALSPSSRRDRLFQIFLARSRRAKDESEKIMSTASTGGARDAWEKFDAAVGASVDTLRDTWEDQS